MPTELLACAVSSSAETCRDGARCCSHSLHGSTAVGVGGASARPPKIGPLSFGPSLQLSDSSSAEMPTELLACAVSSSAETCRDGARCCSHSLHGSTAV